MFGTSQFMFTAGRSRLRSPEPAGAPFRPTWRHVRCYDRARWPRPFAALSRTDCWPHSRGCPSFSNFGPSRLSARDTWRPQLRGPCCKSCWGAPLCGRRLFLLAPLDAPRGADGLARVKFLLAHLSDPHVGPLPRPRRRELIGKRVTGYLNWTRSRSRIHDMAVLEQIVRDMKAHYPSHVAMTGDIANLGLPAEFQLARNWLETLGAPEEVSFVPGNHDAYVRGSLPHLARTFAPWTTGEASAGEGFPYLRIRGEVALVGLSSGVPTPLFVAAGYLGRRQLQAAERLLVETGRRGLV